MNRRLLVAIALSASLAVPAAEAVPVYVNIAPPAPRVEVKIAAPGPAYVWTPGYYAWRGGDYVWVGGAWVLPPRPHAVWVAGHWRSGPHGWYWRAGHWK